MALIRETMLWKGTDGNLHSWTGQVLTPPPPGPVGTPVARITATSVAALSVTLSGTTSTEGTSGLSITGYAWNMGDGTHLTGPTASHTYATAGSYKVTLTVTDSAGVTSSTSQTYSLQQNNALPVAVLSISGSSMTVTADGTSSTDADGTVASYNFSWGDGGTTGSTTSPTATHTYSTPGTYKVTLTVKDNQGGVSSTVIQNFTAVAANQPPTAVIASLNATGMTVAADASGSSDPDGTIVSYDWDWGDGSAHGSGKTTSHTYAATGPWTVTLTVTDDGGLIGAATGTATPAPVTSSFTHAVTKPSAANTGAGQMDPAWPLSKIGASGTHAAGTISANLSGVTINGSITIAAGIAVRHCVINGRVSLGTGSILEDCVVKNNVNGNPIQCSSGTSGATIRFNTATTTNQATSFVILLTSSALVERNNLSGSVDGIQVSSGTNNVKIRDNYIHDLWFIAPDSGHSATPTDLANGITYTGPWAGQPVSHNDCIQLEQTNDSIEISGNFLKMGWRTDMGTINGAVVSNPQLMTAQIELSCLMLNNGTNMLIQHNWMDGNGMVEGQSYCINNGSTTTTGTVDSNWFGRALVHDSSQGGYRTINRHATNGLAYTNNVYETVGDSYDGQAVTLHNG